MKRLLRIAKKILILLLWVGGTIGFVAITSAAITKQRSISCKKLHIQLDNDQGILFVDEEDVRKVFTKLNGQQPEGKPIKTLDLAMLEAELERNPYIAEAILYADIQGDLHVKVSQKEPLLRIINNNGVSFYIDKKGYKMPVSSKFTSRIPVATGYINPTQVSEGRVADSTVLNDLYQLALFIENDPFRSALVEQIYVDERGEFEIIPMIGNHSVLIGRSDDLEGKFKRLMIFYKEVLTNVDESIYKTVNVKYKDQIICTKF
jgi:cell division protein FtsQ